MRIRAAWAVAVVMAVPPQVGSAPEREFLWERLADAPSARTEVAAAALGDGRILVAGGCETPDDSCERD